MTVELHSDAVVWEAGLAEAPGHLVTQRGACCSVQVVHWQADGDGSRGRKGCDGPGRRMSDHDKSGGE